MKILQILPISYVFQAIFCSDQGCFEDNCIQSSSIDLPLVTKLDAPLKAELDISQLHKEIRNLIKDEVQGIARKLNLTLRMEDTPKTEVPKQMKSYGFHVQLTNHVFLGSSQIVIFDKVITNIGDAYNPHTGIFTAQTDGLYFFCSTFLESNSYLHLQMMKNSDEISLGHAPSGNSGSGSMNAVTFLKKDDVVFVRHFSGTTKQERIHEKWSFFTGYLVRHY